MYEPLRPVKLAGFLGLIGLTAAAHFGGEHQVLLATVVAVPARLPARRSRCPSGPDAPLTLRHGHHAGRRRCGSASRSPTRVLLRESPHGDGIVVDVLVGTFIGDTAAYLGGRAFGTRRLAPRISPNKTVEGLRLRRRSERRSRSGAPGSTRTGWPAGRRSCSASSVGVVAPLGDLFESKVKRDAGAKDAGTLFGAHGGALDRLDAALFTLVAGYYVWLALS